MSGKVTDLLNFTLDDSPTQKNSQNLLPQHTSPRKSLDNNPFDRFSKQVETFTADPFEFVAAQSKNFKPVISCIRTGNLLGLGDESFDKENNNGNSPASPKKNSRKSSSDSGKKRDSLLKRCIANASKTAMTNDVVAENQIGEKWMNMEMPDDSFNDIMKQEMVLVDSDVSLNDFEAEFNIPMLKEMDIKEESHEEEKSINDTHTSIIDRAIAKLNEIKLAKTRAMNIDDTMTKLKEMVSKVDTSGNGEASQLLEQLCAALNKSSNKNSLEAPPVMVRQGTFDIDKTDDSIEASNNQVESPQLQSVIDKLSEVLGNVNMNVIQSSPDNPQNQQNPVVVVVVNPDMAYGMSDTVTLSHANFNTPQPKPRTRRSQSFSSAVRPNTVAPCAARRESIALIGTPQRAVQPTRRSFSFNSPAAAKKPIPAKRNSILPPITKPASALSSKPPAGPPNRLSFMDKLKPKIGFAAQTQKKPAITTTKTGPMRVVRNPRDKSPNSSVKSLSSTINRQPPVAQSTPMSRFLTPQKPSRVSLITPSRTNTLTVPKTVAGTNIKRRSSFNDKEKPVMNLKPRVSLVRPNTGGLLTQRKFPAGPTGVTSTNRTTATMQRPSSTTLKLRK